MKSRKTKKYVDTLPNKAEDISNTTTRINLMNQIAGKKLFGKNGFNWVCLKEKCDKNCCGSYLSTLKKEIPTDMLSVKGLNPLVIPLTSEDVERLKSIKKPKIRKSRDGHYYLPMRSDGMCEYWQKDGLCGIHEERPLSCRSFPFYIDKYTGLNVVSWCPGIGQGWTSTKEVKKMVKSLERLYKWHLNEIAKFSFSK